MNDMSETACEICQSPAHFWRDIVGYRHFRCSKCRHLFVLSRPSQEELDSYYAEYYDSAQEHLERITKDSHSRLRLLEVLANKFELERKILDVGCASGFFLSVGCVRGWDAFGVERSEKLADLAKSRSGAKIAVGVLEGMVVPGGPFPVVTAWEVVEHAINPRAFFEELARNVDEEGLLAISTPLADGLPARLLSTHYPMLNPPEHLSLFTRDSLKMLAKEFNFYEVHYSSFSNLNIGSIASGIYRLLTGKKLNEASLTVSTAFRLLAATVGWAPFVIDALGYGTEMQVVYKRRAKAAQ
jgi:SAM-dependent methyltransferase